MRHRSLGSSGLRVPEIGLDVAAPIRAGLDEDEAVAQLHQAIDLGITFLDTAPTDGPDGQGEWLLGRVARARRTDRDQLVLATKAGYQPAASPWEAPGRRAAAGQRRLRRAGTLEQDLSPRALLASIDQSLARLGAEPIDLLWVHNPGPDTLEGADELAGFLNGQVAAGKLRAWGAAFTPAPPGAPPVPHPEEPAQIALRELRLPAVAVRYNLVDQDPGRALLDAARVTAGALVARDADAATELGLSRPARRPAIPLEHLDPLLRDRDRSLVQLALLFALADPAVAVALTSATDERLVEAALAGDLPALTEQDLALLAELHSGRFGAGRADRPASDNPRSLR
jgi:aryl-alcohol dehydrogenase-like predicted oxidoreductase